MGNPLATWSAFAAALVSGGLCFLVAVRGRRHTFTYLVTGLLGGVATWNGAEWARYEFDVPGLLLVQALGFGVLPALLLHFSLLLCGRGGGPWLAAVYGVTALLLIPAAGGMVSPGLRAHYLSPTWNVEFLSLALPVLAAGLWHLVRAWHGASPRQRRVIWPPVVATFVCGTLGVLELTVPLGTDAPALANVGGAVASVLFAASILRSPEIFDALATLRSSAMDLFETLDRGIVTLDLEGRVLFTNERAAQMLGRTPVALGDLPPTIRDAFPGAGAHQVERAGRVLQCLVVPVGDAIEEHAHVHVLLEDVTRIYALARDAARREGLAELGSSAATLAHEVRNALTSVRAAAGRAARSAGPDHVRLRESVERLDAVVSRALDLARPLEPEPARCDVETLLRAVAERLPRPPEVAVSAADVALHVNADPDLLAQVIANVVRNAGEAGARRVDVSACRQNGHVEIVLRNDGRRIPEELRPQLFQPFATSKHNGTGIGLALCRKIVAAHAGTIDLRNVEGGVECVMALPATS